MIPGVGTLDGHKAIVTGGGSGIGEAISRRFAADVIARTRPRDEDQARRPRRAREGAGSRRIRRIEELDHR